MNIFANHENPNKSIGIHDNHETLRTYIKKSMTTNTVLKLQKRLIMCIDFLFLLFEFHALLYIC